MHGRCGVAAIVHIPGSHPLSRALLLTNELPDQDLVVQPSRGAIWCVSWRIYGYRTRITSLCLGVIPREPSAENGFNQTTS